MGIDPVTHKPKNDALLSTEGHSNKTASNLSHMAQWESARLEAEARLVRESKLRTIITTTNITTSHSSSSISSSAPILIPSSSLSLDHAVNATRAMSDLIESPTSTLSERGINVKEEGEQEWNKNAIMDNSMPFTSNLHELSMTMATTWGSSTSNAHAHVADQEGCFTNLLLNTNSGDRSLSPDEGGESNNCHDNNAGSSGDGSGNYHEDNKNYWNNILNLMDYSSPSGSPMF